MAKSVKPVGNARGAWSAWLNPKQDKRNPKGQVVYEIQATRNGAPTPVQRSQGTDSEGILYIGETAVAPKQKSESRYRLLVRSFANPKRKRKHPAAGKYFGRNWQTKYPLCGIRTRFKIVGPPAKPTDGSFTSPQGKVLATTSERGELHRYETRFGELPPLNEIRGKKTQGGRPVPKSPKSSGKGVRLEKDPYKALRRARP